MRGGDHDTRELVGEITALRAQRAALLGFPDHAAYVVDDQTAGTTKAVLDMLDEMAGPAMRNLEEERGRIEELLRADGVEGPVAAVGLGVLRGAGPGRDVRRRHQRR